MSREYHLFQIKMNSKLSCRVDDLAEQHGMSKTDVVRTSLNLGIKILEKLLEAREQFAMEYARLLKKNSRKSGNEKTETEKSD